MWKNINAIRYRLCRRHWVRANTKMLFQDQILYYAFYRELYKQTVRNLLTSYIARHALMTDFKQRKKPGNRGCGRYLVPTTTAHEQAQSNRVSNIFMLDILSFLYVHHFFYCKNIKNNIRPQSSINLLAKQKLKKN